MPASRARCSMCGTTFYGRADARYCCGACRQKAHRARAARRAAAKTVPAPELGDTAASARQTRQRARMARETAEAVRHAAQTQAAAAARQAKIAAAVQSEAQQGGNRPPKAGTAEP